MKTVLLTGATGFIGRHCLPSLTRRGFDTHAVTSRPIHPHMSHATWHRADLLDREQLRRVVASVRPSHLLHLAWDVTPGRYWSAPSNLDWLQASVELMRAFVESGGRRATLVGTCAEYDWTASHAACREALTPTHPRSLYAACKHAVQLVASAFADTTAVSASWGRVFALYGPHEAPDRLVPHVIRSLLRGEPAACSSGTQVRDFLHVEDAADALCALLDSPVTGAVNIASGVPVPVKDVATCLARRLGRPDLLRLGLRPTPPDEPPALVAQVLRLSDEVGWRPGRSLPDGLDHTIAWWRARA